MRNRIWITILTAAAAVAQTPVPAPQLSVSGNGSQSIDLPRGWPLVVRVGVLHSLRFQRSPVPANLLIAPATGAWYDHVTFNIAGAGGAAAAWPLKVPVTPAGAALDLPARSKMQGIWQMSGDDTAALGTGDWRLTVHLEVQDGGGWKGAVDSAPVLIHVIDEPAPLPPDQQERKALLQVRFAVNQGDLGTAASIADAFLDTQPADAPMLELRALLYEQAGDLMNAAGAASAAVDAVMQAAPPDAPDGGRTIAEVPDFLLQLQTRLWAAYTASLRGNGRRDVR